MGKKEGENNKIRDASLPNPEKAVRPQATLIHVQPQVDVLNGAA